MKNLIYVVLLAVALYATWYNNKHPKEFNIAIIQNEKIIGYSDSLRYLPGGCKHYYSKGGKSIGTVCGSFRTKRLTVK